jgi:hypothetical protein
MQKRKGLRMCCGALTENFDEKASERMPTTKASPEKWEPVFRKDLGQTNVQIRSAIQRIASMI